MHNDPEINLELLCSPKVEQAALGSLLIEPALLSDARLDSQHFYNHRNGYLMTAMRKLNARGMAINQVTVVEELRRQGKDKENCDFSYIADLVTKTPSAFDYPTYETQLLDLYSRRQIKKQMEKAAAGLNDFSIGAEDVVNELVRDLPEAVSFDNGRSLNGPETVSATELLSSEDEEINWLIPGYIAKGSVFMLGGPGKGGKSYLMLDAAISLASAQPAWNRPIEETSKVMYVDAENNKQEVRRRIGRISKSREWSSLDNLILRLHSPYDMTKAVDVNRLRNLITSEEAEVVVIDSLIDFTGDANENDNSEMSRVMREFTDIARTTECTVIIIHHTRKGNRFNSGGQDGSRGASAIVNSVDDYFELQGSGGRGTVRGVALRSQQEADGFSFTIIDDAPAITIAYGERTSEGKSLQEEAGNVALTLLEQHGDWCKRADLLQALRNEGLEFSDRTFAGAVKFLSQTGKITEKRDGRVKLYRFRVPANTRKDANI